MNSIPDGLIVQAASFQATGTSDVMRPVFGNLGPLPAEFKIERVFNAGESEEAGIEVERKVELAIIHSDRFSKVPLRTAQDFGPLLDKDGHAILDERGKPLRKKIRSELSRSQEIALAPLYKQFKEQKDSTDTRICDWQASRDDEREFLKSIGIWTVEQLHAIPEHDRYKLGPNGLELWQRADRHMLAKDGKKREEATEEMLAVLEANKEMREQNKLLQEQMYRMQEQLSKLSVGVPKNKGGRPRKAPVEQQEAA